MSRPFFSPSSRRDLQEVLEFIARDKPGAAVGFVDRLEEACWMLAKNSSAGTAREDLLPGLRSWSVGSHVIFYRQVEDGIDVIRVLHGARDHGSILQQ